MNKKIKSNKQEKKVAREIGGRTTIASGALYFQKADVRTSVDMGNFLIECKTTKNDYYILTQKTWDKIEKEALKDRMRIPLLQVQLEDGADELVVMNIHDFMTLGLDKYNYMGNTIPYLLDRMSFRVTAKFTKESVAKTPTEIYFFREDTKLVNYNLHLVTLEWNDFLYMIEEE